MPLNARQKEMLKTMGVSLWNTRLDVPELKISSEITEDIGVDIKIQSEHPVDVKGLEEQKQFPVIDWQLLQNQVQTCEACVLHSTRKNTVFGVGDTNASWMIIGEAPGVDEDVKGEPFVGEAGQMLNQMLISIGLSRETVFVANILKCRPPNNRDPHVEEVAACQSFLDQQIGYIKPKVILAVGRVSAQNLLQTKETIGRLRGEKYFYRDTNIPVIATYHPAYLLRSPLEKRKVWQDLVLAKRIISA